MMALGKHFFVVFVFKAISAVFLHFSLAQFSGMEMFYASSTQQDPHVYRCFMQSFLFAES